MNAAQMDPVSFRKALSSWYRRARRDLPWRRAHDPWAIWISEVMLQQTRVETVRPRFAAFLAAFPSPAALAAAPEEAVLAHWSGLGYYARARQLRRGASVVADLPGGAFPRDLAAARTIPGVGPYTAAAVLSIAYGLPHAVVDGNVARVLSRLYRIEPPNDRPGAQTQELAQSLLDPDHPGDHNQAMMELGALVCLPARPDCGRCPVRRHCLAQAEGAVHLHPAPRPRPQPLAVRASLLVLRDHRDRLLLERGSWPLLPHLWLPVIREHATDLPAALQAQLGLRAGSLEALGTIAHTITRHRIRLQAFAGRVGRAPKPLPASLRFVTEAELAELGRSSLLTKALCAERRTAAESGDAANRPGGAARKPGEAASESRPRSRGVTRSGTRR